MKTLILVRHGKAAGISPTGSDMERPLAEEGKAFLKQDALFLKKYGLFPVKAVFKASSALRAASSLRILMTENGLDPEKAEFSDILYSASGTMLLHTFRTLPDAEEAAVFCLHNPAVSEAVQLLTGTAFPGFSAGEGVYLQFKTDSWNAISAGTLEKILFFPETV